MILRSIQEKDIEACAALYAQVFSSEPWDENWSEGAARERLLHFYHSNGFCGVLAEQDGVVGFSLGNIEPFYSGSIFYLREMCRKANMSKMGVGHKVLAELERELLHQEVQDVYLITDRAIPASDFYQKNGFNHSDQMGFYAKHIKA